MHTIEENKNPSIDAQIKDWEEVAQRAKEKISTLRTLRDRFPDAEIVASHYFTPGPRYVSKAAHEVVTHYDPTRRYQAGVSGTYSIGCLYLETEGGGRIYSGRPVDVVEGFARFQAPGYRGTLTDAMRSTTKAAEEAVAIELKKEAEENARTAAEKERENAQCVRLIESLAVGQSST